jgi:hypothetical protein
MPLSDIVTATVTTSAKGVSQAGFGVPLIAAYHTNYTDRVRQYATLASMVTDGFTAYTPAYRAAAKIFGQTPRPDYLKVGRRALPPTQVVQLAPQSNTVGTVYEVTVTDPAGNATDVSHTVTAGETIADICAALQTDLDAITNSTCTDESTYVECTADNAGELFYFDDLNDDLWLTDVTTDPGIAEDLAAIQLADPEWYALCLDSNSEAEIKAAQAYIETLEKIAAYHTCDAGVRDASTDDDVASDLQDGSYVRYALVSSKHHSGYAGAALLGRMLPQNPGRATWIHKTLTGVTVDSLNDTQCSTIMGKAAFIYVTVAGLNMTLQTTPTDGMWLDIVRGRDWLVARMRERIVSLLANATKVPYTDVGVDMVINQIRAQLRQAQDPAYGLIALTPEFVITAPKVADVSTANKAARLLPDVNFEATLQGAIHKVTITGVVAV